MEIEVKTVSIISIVFSVAAILCSVYCLVYCLINRPIKNEVEKSVVEKTNNKLLLTGGGILSVTTPLKVGDEVETIDEYVKNWSPYIKGTIMELDTENEMAVISHVDKNKNKHIEFTNVHWLRLAPIMLAITPDYCYISPGMLVKTKKSYNVLYGKKMLIGKVKEVVKENDVFKCLVEYCNFNDTDIVCSSIYIDYFWLLPIIEE